MNPGIERVQAAIVRALEGIATADGYRTDVAQVLDVPFNPDQLPEGPSLTVIPVPDGLSFKDGSSGGVDGTVRVTDRYVIGGVLPEGTADLREQGRRTALNLFLEDACDALIADPHFGLAACDSRLEAGDRGVDADRGFGYFSLRLHLTYHFARGTMR